MPRMDKLSTYRTTIAPAADGGTVVTYVSTPIVHIHPDRSVTLRTGGHRSVTTKRKMNQAARQFGLPYVVYQKAFEWYVVTIRNDSVDWANPVEFAEGMTVK